MKKLRIISLLFAMLILGSFSQERKISGKVTNASNDNPIHGVSVTTKGETASVLTDRNGWYSIKAEISQTLKFAAIGYEVQEIKVGSKSILNVQLSSLKSPLIMELVADETAGSPMYEDIMWRNTSATEHRKQQAYSFKSKHDAQNWNTEEYATIHEPTTNIRRW